jgi:DNA polymerase-3 subunit alpha/error-prone DNA polymerase
MGYRTLALTDTDNLYGLWKFLRACRCQEITPIIGAEITDTHTDKRAVCLVKSAEGYKNLCRMLTGRHIDPSFSLKDDLPRFAAGMVVLTRDPQLLTGWFEFGVDIAAAMPRRPLFPGHPLVTEARRLNVPLTATPGTFFLYPEQFRVHQFLRAIDQRTTLSRLPRDSMAPADSWLAPPDSYARRFDICPEAIRSTFEIAEKLTFTGPTFGPVLPPWSDDSGQSADDRVRMEAYSGAESRYGKDLSETLVDRLEKELRIIRDMGFSSYFLTVRDIVRKSPRTCGRGSGAASLVAYCLGITNVCPVKHNLYFERFLNPGRTDPPDIDVDFAWDERDGVLTAVLEQFRERAAMVCNHVTFQPRMAIREVAKVFGLSDSEIGEVTKKLPWFWKVAQEHEDLMQRLMNQPELKGHQFIDPWPEILSTARQIIGIPRYLSVHPGGVIITPEPLCHYVPVETAAKGVPIIQWEKDGAEDAGLTKIDLLGNRSLGVIRDALSNIRSNGVVFDETRWEPEDDYPTQAAVARGQTMGCFYIESPAMRLLQQKAAVGDFDHLVIHSSIIRPAANEFIREYIRRLHGGSWDPIHPLLSDVLNETFGLMVFQEDVSRAAVCVAGFSHSEADGLRKILSKKDKDLQLRDYHQRFVSGAKAKGLSDKQIQSLWEMIISFEGYSFCKPHSASYARISFQAAFLKTHFPAEFMASVISNQGGFYSTFAYVSESRRMGLRILPPDVNFSEPRWTGYGDTIRAGLQSIKNVSTATRDKIIQKRHEAPFRTVFDFLDRVRPDDPEVRGLVHSGALDRFAPDEDRSKLLWAAAQWQKEFSGKHHQDLLFNVPEKAVPPLPDLPPEWERDRLRRQFAALGFLCDRHPITLYSDRIRRLGSIKAIHLHQFVGKNIRIAGWLITGKTVYTRQGEPMEFWTFEDETGLVESTFFPKAYRRLCHMMDRNRPYLLEGRVEDDWGTATLAVHNIQRIDRLRDSR